MKITEYKKANRVYIIAEIAQAYDGSLGILHSMVKCLANSGVDAVKFQIHIADAESSDFEPFRTNFSVQDRTRIEYWRRMELTPGEWQGVKDLCESLGLEFLATPCSVAAVKLLEELKVARYKIGSGDVANDLLIDHVAETGKEVLISGGMISHKSFLEVISRLSARGVDVIPLQCTTMYPTPADQVHLLDLVSLVSSLSGPVGFSDHSGTLYPSLAATVLGASVVEFHVTFDRHMFGPDSSSSIELREVRELVSGIRFLERSRVSRRTEIEGHEMERLRTIFGKSLSLSRDHRAGETIELQSLEAKKPAGMGIPASNYKYVIGKKLKSEVRKFEFLKHEDLDN